VNLSTFQGVRAVRMAESPLLAGSLPTPPIGQIGQTILPFLRTVAPLSNGNSIVSLTISGFTVVSRNFDASTPGPGPEPPPGPAPTVTGVANLADGTTGLASGGLISIFGSNFSATTAAAVGVPLPNTMEGLSVTANNSPVPLLVVSPTRIDAQMPFNVVGSVVIRARNFNGVSDPFTVTVLAGAPAVFRTATAGPLTGLPTIYRAINNEPVTLANPIHPEDAVTIFATGLGVTSPAVASGAAAPSEPLAAAVATPQVTLGGVPLAISFAGLVPGFVGVYQINAIIPPTVPEGIEVPLTIRQGGYSTTLTVRVVR